MAADAAAGSRSRSAMTFGWPVPDGWGQETIPFPVPFEWCRA